MTSIDDLINTKGAHSEVIQNAARFCLAEMSGDKTPDEMYSELSAAAIDRGQLDEMLGKLAANRDACDRLSRLWLEHVAEDRGPQAVDEALDDAARAMPVVDVSVIAMGAMY